MNTQTLSNTDRTSWKRIAMVWNFYLPYTRKKLIGFTILSFLVEGMMYYAYTYMPQQTATPILLMLSVMIAALMSFSGLVFAKPRGRELQTLLPALGMEKSIVIIGYVAVVIPLLLSIPSLLSWLLGSLYTERNVALLFGIELNASVVVYSVLMLESMALSCLWAVLGTSRKFAMRNGILAVIGYYLTLSFASGFVTGFIAGIKGYSDNFMDDYSQTIYSVLATICGIYIIFAMIKCCRIIKHGI
ncbi:MAG: hypothetical protein K2K82_00870 [Muribaculaceae bacterium]|nr:hypothetical protein [Muribaculaceae bacterium]